MPSSLFRPVDFEDLPKPQQKKIVRKIARKNFRAKDRSDWRADWRKARTMTLSRHPELAPAAHLPAQQRKDLSELRNEHILPAAQKLRLQRLDRTLSQVRTEMRYDLEAARESLQGTRHLVRASALGRLQPT